MAECVPELQMMYNSKPEEDQLQEAFESPPELDRLSLQAKRQRAQRWLHRFAGTGSDGFVALRLICRVKSYTVYM